MGKETTFGTQTSISVFGMGVLQLRWTRPLTFSRVSFVIALFPTSGTGQIDAL